MNTSRLKIELTLNNPMPISRQTNNDILLRQIVAIGEAGGTGRLLSIISLDLRGGFA